MKSLLGKFRRGLFGLSVEETSYARRGFRGATEPMKARLEQVGAAFMSGYHSALEQSSVTALASALDDTERDLRGFAFEGAAMGLALLDALTPGRASRVAEFLRGAGDAHAYMVHVGVGWVWARLPFGFRRAQRRLDPVLGWLAFDGWGFHEGFFHWPKYIAAQPAPSRFNGYERRVFDQGLGRSFWFVNGGNPALIAATLNLFPDTRRADLWSGIGLAATYAGAAAAASPLIQPDRELETDSDSIGGRLELAASGLAGLRSLRDSAGPHWPHLAQGAAFAAKARQRAGNLTDYTSLATVALADMSAGDAARLCDTTLENLPANADQPAYEIWRQRLQNHYHTNRRLQEA